MHFRALSSFLVSSAIFVSSASAHEFWIMPQAGRVVADQQMSLDLKVGTRLEGSSYPYLSARIVRFEQHGRDGHTLLGGIDGDLPALSDIKPTAGLNVLVHQSIAHRTTHDDWQAFERYLTQEGLESFRAVHLERGLPRSGFAERYIRYAKSLIQSGPADPGNADLATGLKLELIAEANPYQPGLKVLSVQLRWQGGQLANRLVNIYQRTNGRVRHMQKTSDKDGRILVPLDGEGDFLLNAVHLEPLDDGPVVWLSHWSSLTFRL